MRPIPMLQLTFILSLLAAACASTSSTRTEPTTPAAEQSAATTPPSKPAGMPAHGMGGAKENSCPMQVPGTTVAATDIEGGVALDFTTSPEHLDELRQHVQHMADMHNQHSEGSGNSMGHGGMMGGGMHGGMGAGGMMSPAATASVEQIERGARLVLRPTDASQLEALRQHAHMRAEHMGHESCPMMSAQAQQTVP